MSVVRAFVPSVSFCSRIRVARGFSHQRSSARSAVKPGLAGIEVKRKTLPRYLVSYPDLGGQPHESGLDASRFRQPGDLRFTLGEFEVGLGHDFYEFLELHLWLPP
jgi:hypothetical protein